MSPSPARVNGGDDGTCVTDASVTDASVTDASVTDASVTDASVTDASVTDASVTDASVTDASVTDGREIPPERLPYTPHTTAIQSRQNSINAFFLPRV